MSSWHSLSTFKLKSFKSCSYKSYFLSALGIADFVYIFFVIVIIIVSLQSYNSYQEVLETSWDDFWSKIVKLEPFARMGQSASIYLTMLLTFERFYAICILGIRCIFNYQDITDLAIQSSFISKTTYEKSASMKMRLSQKL